MGEQRDAIEQRIRDLYKKTGFITPDIVISDAKKKDSPLHDQFNWNVEEAAMEAWRETARRIIRSVRVVITVEDVKFPAECRVLPEFIRDPSAESKNQGYSRAAEIRNDHELAVSALMYEIERADGAIGRARGVAEALGLSDEINIVSSAIATVRKKAKGAA